jgi:hypothetical protein
MAKVIHMPGVIEIKKMVGIKTARVAKVGIKYLLIKTKIS